MTERKRIPLSCQTNISSVCLPAVKLKKSAVMDGAEYKHLSEQEQKIMLLDGVGDVLFQALLLDDVEYGGNQLCANLHTIYCFNEKAVTSGHDVQKWKGSKMERNEFQKKAVVALLGKIAEACGKAG